MSGLPPAQDIPGPVAREAAARATAGGRRRGVVASTSAAAGVPLIGLPLLSGQPVGAVAGGCLAVVLAALLLYAERLRSARIHAELLTVFAELESLLDAGRISVVATRTGQRLAWGGVREPVGLSVRRALISELASANARGGCWSSHSPWCAHRSRIALDPLLRWAVPPAVSPASPAALASTP